MQTITAAPVITFGLVYGFRSYTAICPQCDHNTSERTQEQAQTRVTDHVCAPENVRLVAAVWTLNAEGQIEVAWTRDVETEPVPAAQCGYCLEYGPFGEVCPGAAAHAEEQVDREECLDGFTAAAALFPVPEYLTDHMARTEIETRLRKRVAVPAQD
ncbi:hypothetical protein ACIA8G_35305 [Lentzea sp. NPDC051213]|uniref:hypothetical protein n=1 Tax=Lentzea sp. NPDC051213 TaxID=3364126 RepID=UPI0037A515ED